jgi:hypothetical protein
MSAAHLAVESTQPLDTRLVSRQQLNSISYAMLRDNIKSKGAIMAVGWEFRNARLFSHSAWWVSARVGAHRISAPPQAPKANGCAHAIAA